MKRAIKPFINVPAALLATMRPTHWVKNGFVFAPMFFGGRATDLAAIGNTALMFTAFCAISSAVYIFNDILDRKRDRAHPLKSKRPIASGRLTVPVAAVTASVLALFALIVGWKTAETAALVLLVYLTVNVLYSFVLKHIVIVDVFCIAAGFVLRVIGGGIAASVSPSPWLITATFLLSLFLALAKRRHELISLTSDAHGHRPVLNAYTPALVDELISVVTPVTLISYLLYTLDPATQERFGSGWLYVTGAFVVLGIFRYLFLMHKENLGGSPTDLVFSDIPLLAAVMGWVLAFVGIIYFA